MSKHICRDVLIGYSPACDRKWCPEFMKPGKLYPVYGYENGSLKLKDGGQGEAFYYLFAGEGFRPCRLIESNAIIVPVTDQPSPLVVAEVAGVVVSDVRNAIEKAQAAASAASKAAAGDDPGF